MFDGVYVDLSPCRLKNLIKLECGEVSIINCSDLTWLNIPLLVHCS